MEIHNIQKHNTSQTFKALRLKKGAESYIKSMPKQLSEKIDKISKDLENTTYYHLDIGKDGYYICNNDNEKYYLPISIVNAGKTIIIKVKQGLSQISIKLNYKTINEAINAIRNTTKTKTQIERTSEIVKTLDNYYNEYNQKGKQYENK